MPNDIDCQAARQPWKKSIFANPWHRLNVFRQFFLDKLKLQNIFFHDGKKFQIRFISTKIQQTNVIVFAHAEHTIGFDRTRACTRRDKNFKLSSIGFTVRNLENEGVSACQMTYIARPHDNHGKSRSSANPWHRLGITEIYHVWYRFVQNFIQDLQLLDAAGVQSPPVYTMQLSPFVVTASCHDGFVSLPHLYFCFGGFIFLEIVYFLAYHMRTLFSNYCELFDRKSAQNRALFVHPSRTSMHDRNRTILRLGVYCVVAVVQMHTTQHPEIFLSAPFRILASQILKIFRNV